MATPLNYDGRLKDNAQRLRRELTRQERHLWYDYLKSCPAQILRATQNKEKVEAIFPQKSVP